MKMTGQLFMKLTRTTLILGAIILIGLFFRIINISDNPKSLYGDELSLAYDTYSILKTGHDQTGQFLPLIFQLGGGRPGGYVYGSVPFVALFGPTALGVRLLSILSGLGIMVMVFLFGQKFFTKRVGLIFAGLVAVSPWDISLSRGGFEAHFGLFLSLLGVYLFLNASRNKWGYVLSSLSFLLAMNTYPIFRLIIPIFVIFLIIYQKTYKLFYKSKQVSLYIFTLVIILGLVMGLFQTFGKGGDGRFSSINLLAQNDIQQSLLQKINSERNFDGLPTPLASLFHNKFLENIEIISESYFKNLEPNFLFLHGDGNPVHNPGVMGEFYIVDLILITLGFLWLLRHDIRFLKLLMGWILIAPLSTALVGDPHALRSVFMLPPLIFASGLGIDWLISQRPILIRLLIGGLIIIWLINFGIFVDRVYFVAPSQFSDFWAYSSKQAADLAITNKLKYNFIIISNKLSNIQFAYPVYAALPPSQVIAQNQHPTVLNGLTFMKYDNVYLGSIPDDNVESFMNSLPGSVIYISSRFEKPHPGSYSINGPDGLVNLEVTSK